MDVRKVDVWILPVKGTIQRALRMHLISVYFYLKVRKLYHGPIRLLADHNFTVQVESIARGHWMVHLLLVQGGGGGDVGCD